MPYMEFLSRLPLFLSWPSLHHDKTHETKIKQTTNTNIHNNQMLSVDMFLHVCMCENVRCLSLSHRHQPTHCMWLQTNTHTYTYVSIHRPAHLCRTPPPFCSILLQSFCSSSVILLGVGVLFVGWEERGGETDGEEEWREGGDGGAGWSSAGQSHCVDDLLQLAPQSLSPRLLVPFQRWQDLKIERRRGQWMLQTSCWCVQTMPSFSPNKAVRGHQHLTSLVPNWYTV